MKKSTGQFTRADLYMVAQGLAPTRNKAQELIDSRCVFYFKDDMWLPIEKAGLELPPGSDVQVRDQQLLRYVSRGGLKLEGALRHLGFDPRGLRCLDCGCSTGGFTDCLIQYGAKHVVGFDVGHGQLDERLKGKFVHLEGLHIRDASGHPSIQKYAPYDLITMDLSFISLESAMPHVTSLINKGGHLLALVKPQYEVGPKTNANKLGNLARIEHNVKEAFAGCSLKVEAYFESVLKGRDGTQEYFVFGRRP